jgi:hypothetical protein
MKTKIIIYSTLIGCILYAIYNRYTTISDGENIISYAIEEKGYRMGNTTSEWKYIYIHKDKPFFAYITDENNVYGSKYYLKINKYNPSRHVNINLIKGLAQNKLIFYGLNFGNGYTIKIKTGKIVKSLNFNESFGIENEFYSKVDISIYKKKQLLANYFFEFEIPRENKFYAIYILPSPKKIQKKIFFFSSGEVKQYVKPL